MIKYKTKIPNYGIPFNVLTFMQAFKNLPVYGMHVLKLPEPQANSVVYVFENRSYVLPPNEIDIGLL